MKKYILAFVAFISTPAYANEVCNTLGEYAEKAMEGRQLGMSQEGMLSRITTNNEDAKRLMKAVINLTFAWDSGYTEESKFIARYTLSKHVRQVCEEQLK